MKKLLLISMICFFSSTQIISNKKFHYQNTENIKELVNFSNQENPINHTENKKENDAWEKSKKYIEKIWEVTRKSFEEYLEKLKRIFVAKQSIEE